MGGVELAGPKPEYGPLGGCGTNSARGHTGMLPHTPQHPPLEFETEAQLSQ